jgi:hypothetical protein
MRPRPNRPQRPAVQPPVAPFETGGFSRTYLGLYRDASPARAHPDRRRTDGPRGRVGMVLHRGRLPRAEDDLREPLPGATSGPLPGVRSAIPATVVWPCGTPLGSWVPEPPRGLDSMGRRPLQEAGGGRSGATTVHSQSKGRSLVNSTGQGVSSHPLGADGERRGRHA